MEKDLVYLVWTDVNTGNKYKVAYLNKILQELKELNLKKFKK